MLKFCLREITHVSTPSDHNNFNSSIKGCKYTSIKGCKYTSILLFGLLGPVMTQFRNIYGLVIHISGGSLYGVRNTCKQEYGPGPIEKGAKPSAHKPNVSFLVQLKNLVKVYQNVSKHLNQMDDTWHQVTFYFHGVISYEEHNYLMHITSSILV